MLISGLLLKVRSFILTLLVITPQFPPTKVGMISPLGSERVSWSSRWAWSVI
ncbi:hypothetical protein HanRHA438_Chr05g0210031 [Helianthus annuus]|nr:hypothetical protein HanRHA438_Chr05g0210031 [Helianthus annuus]